MRRRTFVATAVAGVFFASGIYAQGREFYGKWVPDTEKTQASADAAVVASGGTPGRMNLRLVQSPLTITQDAKTLTIESERQNVAIKTVYNLDGSASKNLLPATRPGDPPIEEVSTVKWNGDKLVIISTSSTLNRTRYLYLENGELVSETEGRAGSTKAYYKKG